MRLNRQFGVTIALTMTILTACAAHAESPSPERGEKHLFGRAFNPPAWSAQAYQNAGRFWGKDAKQPANYDDAFRLRYGLHEPPFVNNGLPMGLRSAKSLISAGITTDCLLCHGGSIMGRSYAGLGNTALDLQALFEDLAVADGRSPKLPFTFSNVRGTSEAGAISVYLLGWRDPDLKMRKSRLELGLRDDLCEDVPAWWLLKKKRSMYYTGGGDARSVRSLMQFMLSPLTLPSTIDREEAAFRDIQAFILSMQAPKYPFPIDRELAGKGEKLFTETCARCHGTYGKQWTYPNKIIPLDEIGTDPNRFYGISAEFVAHYNKSWFGHEHRGWMADEHSALASRGYQAPPLDGIWATAPYLHNGSVPTVHHLLNSKSRPKIFTRSYKTDKDAYDSVRLGWKIDQLESGPPANLQGIERRKVYDTTQNGRHNTGHNYGDELSEEDRQAVIEYLKTL